MSYIICAAEASSKMTQLFLKKVKLYWIRLMWQGRGGSSSLQRRGVWVYIYIYVYNSWLIDLTELAGRRPRSWFIEYARHTHTYTELFFVSVIFSRVGNGKGLGRRDDRHWLTPRTLPPFILSPCRYTQHCIYKGVRTCTNTVIKYDSIFPLTLSWKEFFFSSSFFRYITTATTAAAERPFWS